MSKMIAIAMPIAPDKFEQWKSFTNRLNTDLKADFKQSRDSVGVHERTFLQKTPDMNLVIVTLEGDDPMGSFAKLANKNDEFTKWFVGQVKDVHGVDISQPLPGPPPELVVDTWS